MEDFQLRVCSECGAAFVQNTLNPFPNCPRCRADRENNIAFFRFLEQRRVLRRSIQKLMLRIA